MMSVRERLRGIRPEACAGSCPTGRQRLLRAGAMLALGAALGLLAKRADGIPVLGEIGTELGLWVLLATVIAAWSRSPRAAALHVCAFFAAMLAAYYAYSMVLFAFFPRHYALVWGGFALLSPAAGYIVWYARGEGWLAALCASLPVALLLAEGQSFCYTFSIPRGLALLSALLLTVALPARMAQRLRMIPFVAILYLLITRLHVTSLLFGGL